MRRHSQVRKGEQIVTERLPAEDNRFYEINI